VCGGLVALTVDRGRIYPNVFIRNQALGGLTPAEAERAVSKLRLPEPNSPISVRGGDAAHSVIFRDTGLSLDIPRALEQAYRVGRTGPPLEQFVDRLAARWHRVSIAVPVIVDSERASRFVCACVQRFDHPPANAKVEVVETHVSVIPGKPGVQLDTARAVAAMRAWAEGGCQGELTLPARMTGPTFTAEQLKDIDTVLSSVRTSLSGSSRNRRHNIALAAQAVDGRILMPDEVFSYNETVGPRTEDKGYRTAPVLRNGKLVPGTGGGACQLSSTLYQAALRAGLATVSRSHHSQPVRYTPAGLDATVVYGAIDLKFRNNLATPVALRAGIVSGRMLCQVVGHGPAPQIELVRRVSWIDSGEPDIIVDEKLEHGQRVVEVTPRRGIRVQVVRRRVADGATVDEAVSTNYYPAERGRIREGPVSPPAPPVAPGGDTVPSVAGASRTSREGGATHVDSAGAATVPGTGPSRGSGKIDNR
jgi:vancomycin resistance protein YoaR